MKYSYNNIFFIKPTYFGKEWPNKIGGFSIKILNFVWIEVNFSKNRNKYYPFFRIYRIKGKIE